MGKCPIVKERRRFTDVMEEEQVSQREARLDAWGREDFSVFKPSKLADGETVQMSYTREVVDGVTPFFREKPKDQALVEGQPLRISCLVASGPRAAIQWLKNDLIFMDDSRLKITSTTAPSSATRSRWATLILTLTGSTWLTTSSMNTLLLITSVLLMDTSSEFWPR